MRAGIAQTIVLALFAFTLIISGCSHTEIKEFAEDTVVEGTDRVIDKHVESEPR